LVLENSGMMKAATSRQPGQLDVQPASSTKKITFADVHGCDEAKQELQEVVDFLRNPAKYANLGGRLSKGVLLTGAPGTGKTLLARATAGEAGVSFLSASGSEFDELFVGVGAKRVRELFAAARKAAPCIIFIDELDAIGSKRSPRDAQHMRQTLNQLLTELDGFNQSEGVILLGATNLPNQLDKALTRPGRFDRHVAVPLPDVRGRMEILKHHIKVTRPSAAVDLSQLARGTPGFSGAQLENLVNQAAVKASSEGSGSVEPRHFDWAKDRILMGAERLSAVITPDSRRKTAFHEAGHALLALYTDGSLPLYHVTVVPRGHSLGHTMQLPEMDRDSESYKELRARLDVAMGGRVAEELIYGKENITSGAESDIRSATSVATAMVRSYGFSDLLGVVNLSEDEKLSSSTLALIESEVKNLITDAQERARNMLESKSLELNRLAEALIEYESLNLKEVQQVIKGERLTRPVV